MMGLDFSHCEARWSYSGFHKFRERICKSVGLGELSDFATTARIYAWEDDIVPLLAHPDCDERLPPKICFAVAMRLREIIAGWPDADYDKTHAQLLIEGMISAYARNEYLCFR